MTQVTITNNPAISATIANDGLNTGDVTFATKGGTFGDPNNAETSGATSDTFGSPGLSLTKESANETAIVNNPL